MNDSGNLESEVSNAVFVAFGGAKCTLKRVGGPARGNILDGIRPAKREETEKAYRFQVLGLNFYSLRIAPDLPYIENT